ncbi:hypothetical protein D3C72_1476330 [compost metagenome]
MLPGQQHFAGTQSLSEGCITRVTGALLETGTRGDLDVNDLQIDAEIVTQALAMGRPGIGRSLQAVVDVNRTKGG